MSPNLEGIKLVKPTDFATHERIAGHLAEPKIAKWFWSDNQRATPVTSYAAIFMWPSNFVLDVGGLGVIAFTHIEPGWRAYIHAARWGTASPGHLELERMAFQVGMVANRLLVVEAITCEANRAARIGLARLGFRRRGRIPDQLCYNSELYAGLWYELSRESAGLEEQ